MHWLIGFHLIAMTAWFAGLFYLPRLFVYHADTTDACGYTRFCIMEYKLYRYIMTPAGIITTGFGTTLFCMHPEQYAQAHWMQIKLLLVTVLWAYHLYCGYLVTAFAQKRCTYSSTFFRFFNECPTVLLISIVLLACVQPGAMH